MLPRLIAILNLHLFLHDSTAFAAKWTKRSADYPTFQELIAGGLQSFKIAGSDCSFAKSSGACPFRYEKRGTCYMSLLLSQLFPDVNIEDSTNKFIVPAKFDVRRIDIFACPNNPKNGRITFFAKSVESVELVPQYLTLGAETRMQFSWNTLGRFDPQKLEVKLRGFTSIGGDIRVALKVEKSMDESDYILKFNLGTLNVNNFLAKFGVDASQMISSDSRFASSRMGLETLILQRPIVDGLFSPGGGFEITATGRITAPELLADASKFYVIVQDFKEGTSDSVNEGYGKPIAAVFALYENERVENTISSLTYMDVPRMAIFKKVDQVAITVATKQIYNINSKTLRNLASKFVPIEGLDMISQGLTVMHYSPNKNPDIKDKKQNIAKRILFRVEVKKNRLIWTSPQRIETQMAKLGSLVWSLKGCKEKLAISQGTRGVFVDITYLRKKGQVEVSFNLTERVPVLENGLVSLFNSTITLLSKEKTEDCSWRLRGEGRESILDELVDVTISQSASRTTVKALANIFDMQTLMNRTKAKPFNFEYEEAFPFLTKLPFTGLRYEASFEWNTLLKFKGVALVDGRPNVEIVYSIIEGEPRMKLGLHFGKQNLYKVINMFYREDKIKSTWIKFHRICIVVKSQQNKKQPMIFDRNCFEDVDKSFSNAGIGLIAETLTLTDCNGDEWQMCNFLRSYIGTNVRMTYIGRMRPKRLTMNANQELKFDLGTGVMFYGTNANSKIESRGGGDRLSFTANIFLTRTLDMFPATIFDDGTNKIMLKFASKPSDFFHYGTRLLGVHYARMDPVQSTFQLPATEHIKAVEFQSRLRIGIVKNKQIDFYAKMSRQYLWYVRAPDFYPRVRFVSERNGLKLKHIFNAFNIPDMNRMLRNARFNRQLVVGYTSLDEVWEVPEFDYKIKKGLHFYGKLTLKTEETYQSTINLLGSMQLQTIIHLEPLRYGKMAENAQGKPIFHHVNLFLYKDSERQALGPDLILEGQTHFLKGYAQTVGLEGPFQSDSRRMGGDSFKHQIRLRGSLYKEVDNVEVTLTANAEDKPKDLKFKYEVDITPQSQSSVNSKLREVLEDIKKDAKKGNDAANEMANDVASLLDSYKDKRQGYLNEMSSVVDQIHNINKDVDLALIDITTDCINECKTVAMPGIDWKEDCLEGSGGQRNMNCMTWNEDKEKVVNVICILKCEAKKMTASAQASTNLEEIRVLVNRYREQKVLSEDVGKLIALMEQADEIAKSAKYLVGNKTDIQDEVKELLTLSGDIIELNTLRVHTNLESISPPCIPFHLDFTMKTQEPTTHNGLHPICFNGEFYKNVGLRIMRMKYPAIDEMYKALEEAELRYARIGGIKKSLTRVENDIQKASKRSNIPSTVDEDPIERMLTKMAKRRIPTFTLKSDKTVLAFHHYSPWAAIKRTDPFERIPKFPHSVKYNTSKFEEKSACHQTKDVIAEYKDISNNLEHLSSNYKHGKFIYGKTENLIQQDLSSSQEEIINLMNKTKLYPSEKRDMLFWYQFTEQGMNKYLQVFTDRLTKQNRRSLSYLRDELSSFYGTNDFVGHLGDLGSDAVSRSTVPSTKKDKQIMSITEIGKELQRALSMNLDEAETVIPKLKDDIQALYYSMASC